MSTIADFYKYATLATASYVRMGASPLTGADFAREANAQTGGRIPLALGTALFNPTEANSRWNIRSYYGGDIPGNRDTTGFGATLLQQGPNGEKILALRGTEP